MAAYACRRPPPPSAPAAAANASTNTATTARRSDRSHLSSISLLIQSQNQPEEEEEEEGCGGSAIRLFYKQTKGEEETTRVVNTSFLSFFALSARDVLVIPKSVYSFGMVVAKQSPQRKRPDISSNTSRRKLS
ncbi:hypothetical protein BHE74_00051304 [Ensete ventricosum]|nr:hypothetical protein BHE74_00051304 [Ensete ventricosum]RZR86363.1 hypothetical protein BHM03_00013550 [Ensete ventricosum]